MYRVPSVHVIRCCLKMMPWHLYTILVDCIAKMPFVHCSCVKWDTSFNFLEVWFGFQFTVMFSLYNICVFTCFYVIIDMLICSYQCICHPVSAFIALTLLVGHQQEHPACKNWVMRCWCGYLSGARCRLFAYGLADATAIQKPNLLLHLNPDWFYLSGAGLRWLSLWRGH